MLCSQIRYPRHHCRALKLIRRIAPRLLAVAGIRFDLTLTLLPQRALVGRIWPVALASKREWMSVPRINLRALGFAVLFATLDADRHVSLSGPGGGTEAAFPPLSVCH